jgi:hypothetical protein
VARVADDQGIGIPTHEPIDQSHLIAKIKIATEEMNIFPQVIIGNLQFLSRRDAFPRPRRSCEETQPTVTGGGEQVKKRRAIVGKDALLERKFAGKTDHGIGSHRAKITAS